MVSIRAGREVKAVDGRFQRLLSLWLGIILFCFVLLCAAAAEQAAVAEVAGTAPSAEQRMSEMVGAALSTEQLLAEEAGTAPSVEQPSAEEAEWTLLFYFSGADLESEHEMVSFYLMRMFACSEPTGEPGDVILGKTGPAAEWMKNRGKVNVLFQTGGSSLWHNEYLPIEIRTDRLQRWSVHLDEEALIDTVRLEEELPLASMADPGTLSDYLRWGKERYPAKKTALILWGHGKGAKGGLLYDEVFGGDEMSLRELDAALKDGGVYLEAIILDACMMANLETAAAVQDSAKYMVASEEVVPGEGTEVLAWLQELLYQPEVDGKRLGRNICDMTAISYGDSQNEEAGRILTWSVIDLSKIPRVVEIFEKLVQGATRCMTSDLLEVSEFMDAVLRSETYGEASDCMRDLTSIFYYTSSFDSLSLYWRNQMLDALTDAVVYCVHGSDRNEARGISFCFGPNMTPEELDTYAENCEIPMYLAFLDALYDSWKAPAWVYEQMERPTEISEIPDYVIHFRRRLNQDGVPGLAFDRNEYRYNSVNYYLYRKNEETGDLIQMGYTPCRALFTDSMEQIWCAEEFWWWPSIEGRFIDIEMIAGNGYYSVYNVPMLIGEDIWYLRYERFYDANPLPSQAGDTSEERYQSFYEIHGLWEGRNQETKAESRKVSPISMKSGQEFALLYRTGLVSEEQRFNKGEEWILPLGLQIEKKLLEPGTYYLQYEVMDIFNRKILCDPVEVLWDGQKTMLAEDINWEGEVSVRWSGNGPIYNP